MYLTKPPPATEPISFEVYYGVSSPWALLGAPEMEAIAERHGLTLHLKPITVIVENGGIRLKARHEARQAYHALDLDRSAKVLGVPLIAKPKYYPQAPGGIELSAQAIIRIQRKFGIGSREALRFSYAVQRCIWVTEGGDHCDVNVLRDLGRQSGLAKEDIEALIVDKRSDPSDLAVKEWERNHREAVQLGIFGTPNYVINGEIFWGQDRLWMAELRIKELLEAGMKPRKYT